MNAQTMITSLLLLTVIGAHSSPKFTNKKQATEAAAAPVSTRSPNVASGVRLEFLKSFFDGKVKLNNGLSSASGSGKVERHKA